MDFELNNNDVQPFKPYFLSVASKKPVPTTDRNKMPAFSFVCQRYS